MYSENENVMQTKEASRLYKLGLLTYEELEEIRKINIRKSKRKYDQSEKGKKARKIADENFRKKENYKELKQQYWQTLYHKHYEEIAEKQKIYQKEYYQRKKQEALK